MKPDDLARLMWAPSVWMMAAWSGPAIAFWTAMIVADEAMRQLEESEK